MRYLVWDFDGTLGYREGGWSGAMLDVLHHRGMDGFTRDQLRPHILTGFRWHDPTREYAVGLDADSWWGELDQLFTKAFVAACRVGEAEAGELARGVRREYLRPDAWRLFEDSSAALEQLSARGYSHVLLTNHAPELSGLLDLLGIGARFDRIFNSADTGVEKPHPRAYANVIQYTGPDATMIGDNPVADVAGARAAGLKAVLVRRPTAGVEPFFADLDGLVTALS